MITIEKLITKTGKDTSQLADVIIGLMKSAYETGFENGYEKGFNDCSNPAADEELEAFFKDGEEEGYRKGFEDGYDEACMDLTDDDFGSAIDGEPA